MANSLITDEQELVSAAYHRFGQSYKINTWDDGFGSLYVVLGTYGVLGVVRASTWCDAYECYVDEIAPDGDDDEPEDDQSHEYACWQEANAYRGGTPSNPRLTSCIADIDYNLQIHELTEELAKRYQLVLILGDYEENTSTRVYYNAC